jgi:group I intron endonuclease
MGFIYKITNTVSGSVYIGQTRVEDPYERFKAHLSNARRGIGCPALTDAIISYGEDKFKFEVLIICFNTDIDYYEIEYIEKYNSMVPNGYNILKGGQCGGGFKGKKHRQEVIEKIKQKLKERYEKNPKERIKLSNRVKQYYENNPEARKKHQKVLKILKNGKKH